jgi:hypothetical protein
MKIQFKNSIIKLIFPFAMLAAVLALGSGCNTSKPAPDPLGGFHWCSLVNLENNKTITDDYKSYIRTLSPDEQKYAGPILYFEDETGRHAVKIMIGVNGTSWEHVLIYDKDNKRINAIKYTTGRYAS